MDILVLLHEVFHLCLDITIFCSELCVQLLQIVDYIDKSKSLISETFDNLFLLLSCICIHVRKFFFDCVFILFHFGNLLSSIRELPLKFLILIFEYATCFLYLHLIVTVLD